MCTRTMLDEISELILYAPELYNTRRGGFSGTMSAIRNSKVHENMVNSLDDVARKL